MLRRVMLVVLLGCLGLTAGVTLGTLFPSTEIITFTTTSGSDGRLIHSGVPMGGYVLLGLLAGVSAAVGLLVPPRSRLTRR
jgi:hypothetical protein